jgi:hypothetical protein
MIRCCMQNIKCSQNSWPPFRHLNVFSHTQKIACPSLWTYFITKYKLMISDPLTIMCGHIQIYKRIDKMSTLHSAVVHNVTMIRCCMQNIFWKDQDDRKTTILVTFYLCVCIFVCGHRKVLMTSGTYRYLWSNVLKIPGHHLDILTFSHTHKKLHVLLFELTS